MKANLEVVVFRFVSWVVLCALFFCAFSATGQNVTDASLSAAQSRSDTLFILLEIQADLQGTLNDINSDVENAAKNLSSTGLQGAQAQSLLKGLVESNSDIVGAATYSKEGDILAFECRGCFGKGEDTDHAQWDQQAQHFAENMSNEFVELMAYVMQTKYPQLSKDYHMTERYNGTALAYPVFSPKGELTGGVAVTIRPDRLMDSLIAAHERLNRSHESDLDKYSFWIMHLDGLIAYDKHPSEIGAYLFEDPIYRPYPNLVAMGERMVTSRSGHGYFTFYASEGDKTEVNKETYWTTVELHGIEWRLAVTTIV